MRRLILAAGRFDETLKERIREQSLRRARAARIARGIVTILEMTAMGKCARAAEIGAAARRYVEERAGLDRFVARKVEAIRVGHGARAAS